MNITAITPTTAPATVNPNRQALDQGDFIRLMTTQMRLQDPLEPVDNKEMIAQMAQFSSLSGIESMNATLKGIAAQLDRVLASQNAAQPLQNNV